MPDDLGTIRAACRADMPGRIGAALDEYQRFVAEPPPADAKGFAAWQAAAKAALAHIELLLKLARWADGAAIGGNDEDDASEDDGLGQLLAQARQALDNLEDDAP